MSREKAAAIAALSDIDKAVWRSKRNQRVYWQRMSHDEWVTFCQKMAAWFGGGAAVEWDNQVIANIARKAASDKAALVAKEAVKATMQ